MLFTLIKNEMKGTSKNIRGITPKINWVLNIVTIIVIIVAFLAVTNFGREPQNVWYALIGLSFLSFIMSFGLVAQEWRNGTKDWWLTLPFSRFTIIFSKFCGGLGLSVISYLLIYVLLAGAYWIAVMASSNIAFGDMGSSLLVGLIILMLSICFTPFMCASGILMAVSMYTRLHHLIRLLWVIYGAAFGFFVAYFFEYSNDHQGVESVLHSFSMTILVSLLASWIMAYLMIRFSSYLLDHKLDL